MKSIKAKLFLGTVVVIITFIIINSDFFFSFFNVVDDYSTLTDNISSAENVVYITDQITDKSISIYSKYEPDLVEEILLDIELLSLNMDQMDKNISYPSSLYTLRRLKSALETLVNNSTMVIKAIELDNVVEASIHRDSLTKTNVGINSITQDLIRDELTFMREYKSQLEEKRLSIVIKFIFASIAFISLIFVMLFNFNRGIYINIGKLLDLFKKVGAGDLNVSPPTVHTNDEFKLLVDGASQMIESLKRLTLENKNSKAAIVAAIGSLAEVRDNETGEHINSIQHYLSLLCYELKHNRNYNSNLGEDYIETVVQVAPLHDIGKVGIPDNILQKPGKLNEDEFEIMKTHVLKGQKVIHNALNMYDLEDTKYFEIAENVIADHHEKWDGSGYPKGIKGEQISLCGRLVALVDVYDALTSDRIYKKAYSHNKAVEIILEGKASHFDPAIVDAFMAIEKQYESILNEKLNM